MPSAEFTEPLTFLMGDYELPAPVHTPAWHHYTKIYDSWNRCDMYVMNGLNNARIDTGNTLIYYTQPDIQTGCVWNEPDGRRTLHDSLGQVTAVFEHEKELSAPCYLHCADTRSTYIR